LTFEIFDKTMQGAAVLFAISLFQGAALVAADWQGVTSVSVRQAQVPLL